MRSVVGCVGLYGTLGVVGSEICPTLDTVASEQHCQALRSVANGQDNVLCGVAESVVCCQVGSDLVGIDLCSCSHKKSPHFAASCSSTCVVASDLGNIRFRVTLPKGQVGQGVGPFLSVKV